MLEGAWDGCFSRRKNVAEKRRGIRVAINGFGRIGKMTLRALLARNMHDQIDVVAINELALIDEAAQLFRLDTAHGRFPGMVEVHGATPPERGVLRVNGSDIFYLSEPDPAKLPWYDLGIDIVLDCTGRFVAAESAGAHLQAGARRVIISAPAKGVPLIVYGVNDDIYCPDMRIVSNASCTTNCAAPIAKVIKDAFGIRHANLLTVHAATAGQNSVDGTPPGRKGGDLRLARATIGNMIPTKTGAAKSVGDVLPDLKGKFDGVSLRVPTVDGSFCYCTFDGELATTVECVIEELRAAEVLDSYHGVLMVSDEPLVSSDIINDPHSAIVDAGFTRVIGDRQIVVSAWYDNEWGYANRMVDMALHVVGSTL